MQQPGVGKGDDALPTTSERGRVPSITSLAVGAPAPSGNRPTATSISESLEIPAPAPSHSVLSPGGYVPPYSSMKALASPPRTAPQPSALSNIAADPRIRTAINAARKTVARGARALGDLSTEVAKDERSQMHSALTASQFSILDVYSSGGFEGTDTSRPTSLADELRRVEAQERAMRAAYEPGDQYVGRTACCRRLVLRLRQRFVTFTMAPASWIFLVLLGFLAAVIAYLVDAPVSALQQFRYDTINDKSDVAGYFIWLVWCIAFALVAAVIGHFSPLSEGSGIPQMKSILAGTSLPQYLSLKVAVFKMLGLIAAQTAGLSIGKEGPFVHIACALASKLWRLPYFSLVIGRSESMKRQILAAAVAAGVTGVFGTPVGGVLFSVEVTSTYFLTSSYWRCFLCAIVCRFAFDIITALKADSTLPSTRFPGGDLSAELIAFVILGAICGVIGSAFVYVVNRVRIARALIMTTAVRRYAMVLGVAAGVATLTYVTGYLRQSDKMTILDLFSDETSSPDGIEDMLIWKKPSVIFSLCIFIGIKFLVTVLSISLPIACGLFIPLFVLGAAIGRLVGEVLSLMVTGITPGAYAVVGAAALISGATQTVSTAVIVFELTGQTSYLLPVLLATLVAYSVSSIFTVGMYDMLMMLAGLPYLPRVYASETYNLTAKHIMRKKVSFLSLSSTRREALELMHSSPTASEFPVPTIYEEKIAEFPVVESRDSMILVGSISRGALEHMFAVGVVAASTRSSTQNGGGTRNNSFSNGSNAIRENRSSSIPDRAKSIVSKVLVAPASPSDEDYASIDEQEEELHESRRESAIHAKQSGWTQALASHPESILSPEWLDQPIIFKLQGVAENESAEMLPAGLRAQESEHADVSIDPAPFQVSELMPLPKIHFLFAICLFSHMFVTRNGRLRGVIMKDDIAKSGQVADENARIQSGQADDRTHLLTQTDTLAP